LKLKINTIQKRVGFLITTVGTFVIISNIAEDMYAGLSIGQSILTPHVWLDFILFIPGYVSLFVENKFLKFFQVLSIALTGVANIVTAYDEVYGPSLFFMAWLLARQYGYFRIKTKLKYILLVSFLVILAQGSAYIHNTDVFILHNSMLQFSLFMILFVLAIWKDIFYRDETLLEENKTLRQNYKEIEKKILSIELNKKPFNLKNAHISPAEERVLRILIAYKASNREIAERLNISESTVKLHLYNIFNKLGVDNRFTVIDLCKYNFK